MNGSENKSTEAKVRRPDFQITPRIENHWMGGNSINTHFGNVFHATIPAGERFLIRILSEVRARFTLGNAKAVTSFMGQEGQHAYAHGAFTSRLKAQGYDPDRLNRDYDGVLRLLDRVVPLPVRLSMGAAFEHYTASMGHAFLEHPEWFSGMDPGIAKLLLWHSAEEVEHKSVLYDVLRETYPSYALRCLGFAATTVLVGGSTFLSFLAFARKDRELTWRQLARDYRENSARKIGGLHFVKSLLSLSIDYLSPGFHPSKTGDSGPALRFLAALEG